MIRRCRNGTIEADTPNELADYMVRVGSAPAIVDAEKQLAQIGERGFWAPPMTWPALWPVPGAMDAEISIKETITEERELLIVPQHASMMFYGCAAILHSPGPRKLMIKSIRAGFVAANLICDGEELDIHFFCVAPPDRCPFDFGCFSHLAPMKMVVRPCDGPTELDMTIFGTLVPLQAAAPAA